MSIESQPLISRIVSTPEFEALQVEWLALLEHSDEASPFLTPGWQFAWLATYGHAHELFALVARVDAELVGLWPLGRIRRGLFRVLEPIGAGRSDWLDVLTLPQHRSATISTFVDYLSRHDGEWDLLNFRDVLELSPNVAAMKSATMLAGLSLHSEQRTVAPYLPLSGSWEQYLAGKSGNFRSNLKRSRKQAEKSTTDFKIDRREWNHESDLLASFASIEASSWKAREGNLKISTKTGNEFYRQFIAYFSSRGEIDLWCLSADGVISAYLINIVFRNKCYHYNSAFNELAGELSPGVLLHADAIRHSLSAGHSEYDFLSGDESYKSRWAGEKRIIAHVVVHHKKWRSVAAYLVLIAGKWSLRKSTRLQKWRNDALVAFRKATRNEGKQ